MDLNPDNKKALRNIEMLRTKHFKTALASTSYYDNMIIIFHVKLLMLAKFVSFDL